MFRTEAISSKTRLVKAKKHKCEKMALLSLLSKSSRLLENLRARKLEYFSLTKRIFPAKSNIFYPGNFRVVCVAHVF